MAQTAKRLSRQRNEQIDVRVFQDVTIRFPGDVFILATWMAMSDMAKSTPTCRPHTTLHGLARSFAMLHGNDYFNPLNSEDVMAVFRKHGILGNPTLRMETTQEEGTTSPIKLSTGTTYEAKRLAAPRIDEQSHALEPAARSVSDRELSPPAQ